MGSRDNDRTTQHHQPLLSSLVLRASDSDGVGGGRGGSDYEPGEVRRDPPPNSRSDRYSDDPGYRIRAGFGSPVHRRAADHQYSSRFDHSSDLPRHRRVDSGRGAGRYLATSPPYGQGRGGDRPFGRGFDGPGFGSGPYRGEVLNRDNPNVHPREGDWYCPDPLCGNLNFARREYCNTCKKHRYGPRGSPRRGYSGPPPHAHSRRVSGPAIDCSPGRPINGYRSPPRGWARDGPKDFGGRRPFHPRHEGRFPDHHMQRDRPDYPEEISRERNKFDRPMPLDRGQRDRGKDDFFNDRKGFERRLPSPPSSPQPTHRGRWPRDVRERSRSPIRGVFSPKNYRRDMYMGRGRDDQRGVVRDTVEDTY